MTARTDGQKPELSWHGSEDGEGVGTEPFGIPGSSRSGDPYPTTPLAAVFLSENTEPAHPWSGS